MQTLLVQGQRQPDGDAIPDAVQVICSDGTVTLSFRADPDPNTVPVVGERYLVQITKVPSLGVRVGE
jgi:hypothetical protein